jgi:mRNA interferase MazF
MGTPSAGAVVLVQFPFSDLSQSKLRPAVVLAEAERGDWVLCQITSKAYADTRAIGLQDVDLVSGSLRVASYVRPGKLFTAHATLIKAVIGKLKEPAFYRALDGVVRVLGFEVARVLSATVNAAVVQLPGRKFPGSVIQGDTLKIALDNAEYIHSNVGDTKDEELLRAAMNLRDSLRARLLIYEQTLRERGLDFPYI